MSLDPTHNYFDVIQSERVGSYRKESPSQAREESDFWGEDGFSFGDLVDAVNPLHHIPVVSDVYEAVSGDTKSQGSDLAGGALFGGIVGFAFSVIDALVKETSGKTMGEHFLALFGDDAAAATPQTASNDNQQSVVGPPAPPEAVLRPSNAAMLLDSDKASNAYRRIQRLDTVELPAIEDAGERTVHRSPYFI